jgi:hypothetical protein
MGWLVKIGFPCHTPVVRPGLGPYVHHVMTGYKSTLTSFRENLIFFPLSAYSSTPKANKGSLRLSNSDRNLHIK